MILDATTKNLTVNPGVADIGSYTLVITYTSDYDGLDPSTLVKTKLHTIVIFEKSVDCSALSLSSLTYFLGETTTLTLPACTVTPNFCPDNTTGTLIAMDTETPFNFAKLLKNQNNTFSILITSNDFSIINK
jgi:hypothetical protein